MFRRLVERFNAVPLPKFAFASFGIMFFTLALPEYVDERVHRYIMRQKQNEWEKWNALKDTSDRRDGH